MTTGLFKYLHNSQEELNILLNDANTSKIDLADINTAIGYIEYFKNNLDNAISCFENALKIYMELKYDNKIAFCNAYIALFSYLKDKSRIIKTHTLLNDALYSIKSDDSPLANDIKAIVYLCNGIVNYNEGSYSQALNYYKKAMSMTIADSLVYARILDNMGVFYLRSSNFHIAMTYLQDAIEIKKRYNIPLDLATTKTLLGRYYISIENYPKALDELKETLSIISAYNDTISMARIKDEIAKIYINTTQYAKAEEIIENALKECESFKNHPSYPYLNCTYVSLLIKQDKIQDAVNILEERVIPVFEKSNSPRTNAMVKQLKAEIFIKQNKYEEAISNLYGAIESYKTIKLHFEEAKSYFELAKVYKLMNNPQMVVSSLLEALNVTSDNEFPLLNKKIEDFLYEIDSQEWANIVNKTARKEKLFSESKVLLETLDLLGMLNEQPKQSKDPLLALLRLGRSIAAQTDIDRLIEVIAQETKVALNADRCTVFLYDKEKNELWSKVALGMNSKEIRFPADQGLAGHVIMTGETLNIQNAYESEYFNPEIDRQTGYHTQSILCMPIRNLEHRIIGVFQILNKEGGKYFTNEDEDLLVAIGSNASIALENANLFAKQLQMIEEQQKSFTSFINTLATSIDARDKITAGHSHRVTQYTSIIAKAMNFDADKIDAFEKAALLHDIGKIGVQDSVLFKEGRLTDEEYKHIQKHAEITSEILNQMYFTEKLKDVPEIASSHHEKYDGSGYFRHKSGENIHIGGRILAVSDVFDAITSKRHYRDRMEISNVLKILKDGSGSHFDPKVIDVFFNVSVDKILSILISAYNKDLSEEEVKYFSSYTINNLFEAACKPEEERSEEENTLVKSFNKLYLNEC
ncbi:MAG: GAF domain-containing protein [bacterium]|nr:GAF domain-containing protein [bacterium]